MAYCHPDPAEILKTESVHKSPLCQSLRCLISRCLYRNKQHEGDLEQPLLERARKREGGSDTAAQNGHARSEISDAAGSEVDAAALPGSSMQSVWRDPVVPATLAAVLCLWVLKLVQQGYVDGVNPILLSCLHACASVFHHSSSSTANSSLQAGAFL